MSRPAVCLVCATLLVAPAARAQAPDDGAARDARALAAKIDGHIAAGWAEAKVTPAGPADDAEFLRRVYLDLAGRIPSVTEARHFLGAKGADRRERLVERLLASPRYGTHFTRVWRSLWLPEAGTNPTVAFVAPGFEAWLRKHLDANTGYDQMVRELVTLPPIKRSGDAMQDVQRIYGSLTSGEATPLAFYLAKDNKPEELAAGTARLFLGVSIDCAQCHNHPCGRWKREDFWRFAAFFAGVQSGKVADGLAVPVGEVRGRRQLTIPGTDRVVQAAFLGGGKPQWQADVSPRETLADWLTAADNPYFAKAAVNRVWAYFFGTGLVDPVDDMSEATNPPSHPELLDELARQFAAHRFDLKFLMRAIAASRAYQLTSAGKGEEDPRLFARMRLRSLMPEQLFDSLAQATGYREARPAAAAVFQGAASLRAEFLARFANHGEKATEPRTSILQALTLMNGKLTADATSMERSETLGAIADAPFLDTAGRIEALYLAALSRRPREAELARLVRFVDGGGSGGRARPADRARALADVLWVLLNSGEFLLNH